MDQIWAREHVLTQLKRRQLAGEPPVGKLELQQLAGMGPGDLSVSLGVLVEEGKVVEHGEGATSTYAMAEVRGQEVGAAVSDAHEPPSPFPDADAAAAADVAATLQANVAAAPDMGVLLGQLADAVANGGVREPGKPRELRLTNHVVQAIDSDTLGAMVLAGVIEAGDNRASFVLTVVP